MLFHHRISIYLFIRNTPSIEYYVPVWNFAKYKLYHDLPEIRIFQFFRSFFFFFFFLYDQLNLENQNRLDPMATEEKTGSFSIGTNKNNFIGELKFLFVLRFYGQSTVKVMLSRSVTH